MVALLLLPAVGYFLLVARLRMGPAVTDRRPRRIPWWSPSVWPVIAVSALVLAAVASLLGAIVVRAALAATPSGPPGSAWPYLFSAGASASAGISTEGAIVNSLLFAGVASGLAVLLGILAGFGRRGPARRALRVYLFVPLLVSPVVLAFALATFWRPILGGASEVWLLILLSQATLALPFALQSLDVALASVSRHHRESAQSLGAGPFLAYLEAELPRVRPALVTAALFAFALGLGEFTATYFLATPSFTTVPVELYHFASSRAPGVASALAGLLVVLALAAFLVIQRGGNRALL
jgi:thiamine transport system permease protein